MGATIENGRSFRAVKSFRTPLWGMDRVRGDCLCWQHLANLEIKEGDVLIPCPDDLSYFTGDARIFIAGTQLRERHASFGLEEFRIAVTNLANLEEVS